MIQIGCGQCGNQLGEELLHQLSEYSPSTETVSQFFHYKPNSKIANYIGIDTEPKVIQSLLSHQRNESYAFHESSMLYRHGGAGNNWAMGYQMLSGTFLESVVQATRHQLEVMDQPSVFLYLHSIGGGTGSGLGSKCIEVLTDEFPDMLHLNLVIAPYHFGEVVVQYYNTLLSLSHLTQYSDAIIAYENEIAYNLCKHMCSIDKPVLKDINRVIAQSIHPVLLPKDSYRHTHPSTVYDDVLHLCSHPNYRFCAVYNSPVTSENSIEYTHDAWQALVKTIYK